ncbi:hypothetical protein SDC9_175556 [bioreactor metagenome]|uniref:Uncharacterized protein n=1 Tax=bioreactor metagenome TaxID=1076179 RepID=A0A645GML6_9ZZZZ
MVYIANIKLSIKKLKLLFSMADCINDDTILKALNGNIFFNKNIYLLILIIGVYTTKLIVNIKKGKKDNNK